MSLIEEALRQIQSQESKAPPPAAPPLEVSASPAPPASASMKPARTPRRGPVDRPAAEAISPWMRYLATVGGSVILLVIGLTAGAVVSSKLTTPGPAASALKVPPASSATNTLPVEKPHAVITRHPVSPRLQLHGTVEGVGEPFAVVNGRILRLGETIEGAMLLEVRDGAARFRWRGQDLWLHTS